MQKPIINSTSLKSLNAVIDNLPQSLLVCGAGRTGLSTIAKHIAERRGILPTVIFPEKDGKVDLKNGTIGVEVMRQLSSEVTTKTATERIIIIDYAETMTVQSQNAFLKLLEEPGENIHFILVSKSACKLLPTITSRAEELNIRPISTKQSKKLLDDLEVTDDTKRTQILFIASGLPAEITKLATDDEYFESRTALIRDARELLRGNLYQKLLIAHRYKDDRSATLGLLNDAAKILEKTLTSNPTKETIDLSQKLIKAQEKIEANGNIRLSLSQLVL